ncbi:plastocyanin/azurin family copper-binding protein [Halosimplex marinum]|uniref:plastocyanin/azurin family copper-binding protein n=1 Tax=Halosimplex marinum TaxID=3396620 RepID=UPI003F54362B
MDAIESEFGDVEEGAVAHIDGDRYFVSETSSSSAGKHGTAKVTLETVRLADGAEETVTEPEDATLEILQFERERNPLIRVGGDDPHFDPVAVRVAAGGNVVWFWDDEQPHQVVGDDGVVESDRLAGTAHTFEHAFESPGAYLVRCPVHGSAGVVVVEESE